MKNSKFLTLLLMLSMGSAALLWGCGDDATNPLAPVAGFSFTVDEATGGTVTFSNTSENATNYAWDFGDGNTSTDESPVNTYAANGDYTVELVASNDAGTSSTSSETVAIALVPVAGFSFMIDEATGGTVTFANTSENATSYSWDFGDGNTSTDENPVNTYAANGDYTVELVASNSAGTTNSSSETITISLIPVAGFSYEAVGNTVTFTNTSKNATSYAWDFGDGNGSTDENPVNTYAANGDYTVELVASNDAGATHSFSMEIEITAATTNVAPVFANTSYSFNVASDAMDGAVVGTVSATDTDGDMLTYMISGTDAGHFAINNNSVASGTEVSVTVATNADLPSLTSPVALTVKVSDGTDQVTANVEITIAAGNVAPVFASTDYAFDVASDAAAETPVGTVSATDSNDGDLLTYTISGEGADNFAINNTAVASGTAVPITVAAGADLSSLGGSITLTATVTDDALTATAKVEITIIEGNVAPVFASTDYAFDVASDAAAETPVGTVSAMDSNTADLLIYTISGTDAGSFSINNTAMASGTAVPITVASGADLSSLGGSVTLTATVTDDGTPVLMATANVEITIIEENVAPLFDQTAYAFIIAEGAADGTIVGNVSATDPNAGDLLAYSLSGTDAGSFSIDNTAVASGTDVPITVASGANLPSLTSLVTLTVTVTDNATPALTADAAVEITITVGNVAPVFNNTPYVFNITENAANGDEVGKVSATDSNAGDLLTYTLSGEGAANFTIMNGTAVASGAEASVVVSATATLDHETTPSYTLNVQVIDNATSALTATETVEIAITNVATAPVLTVSGTQTLTLNEGTVATETATGYMVSATDEDGDEVAFSVDDSRFGIADDGTLNIVAGSAFDFATENPITLTVTATDDSPGTLSSMETVEIAITDVATAPVLTVSGTQTLTLNEGTVASIMATGYTVNATDADGDGVTFSVDDGRFGIADDGTLNIVAGSAFDFATENPITLTVTATDDSPGTLSSMETVEIAITDVATAPVITVSGTQTLTLNEGTVASIMATGYTVNATDADGDEVAFSVDDGRFGIADDGALNIVAGSVLDFETENPITLTVTATDDSPGTLSSTETVEIAITDVATAPVITVSGTQVVLDEGTFAAETATGLTITAVDDEDEVTLSVSDPARFSIASVGGALNIVAGSVLDFETENPITLTVTATDDSPGTLNSTETVEIAITDVAEAPVLTVSGTQTLMLNEGTVVAETATGYTVSAADGDGDEVALSVSDPVRFSIASADGALNIVASSVFDHETEATVTLTITATDDSPSTLSNTETVEIAITDVATAPVITVSGTQTTLNEGTFDAVTSTGYAVTATDEDGDGVVFSVSDDRFAIANDGTLYVLATKVFDFETENPITLTVTATDDNTGALTDTQDVTVTLTDITFSTLLSSADVGNFSKPAFGDIDGDGDDDLLVGELLGNLNYYRWDGTGTGWTSQTLPAPLNTVNVGFSAAPAFADVDGDNDLDLLIGELDGVLNYYRWGTGDGTGTGWSNQTSTLVAPLSDDVGFSASPAYGDVNVDGNIDLLVGEDIGVLNYYRWGNIDGTGTGWSNQTSDLNAPLSASIGTNSSPAFVDVDGDGDNDLLVGEFDGVLNYYRWGAADGTGMGWSNQTSTLVAPLSRDVGGRAAPAYGDVDGDGDLDLVVGETDGTLNIYYWHPATTTWSTTSDF